MKTISRLLIKISTSLLFAGSLFAQGAMFRSALPTAAISSGNSASGEGSTGTQATAAFSVTTGSTVPCWITWNSSSVNLSSVTDSAGNTYTLLTRATNAANDGQMAYAKNVTGSGTLVVTSTLSAGPGSVHGISCVEVKGANATTPLDVDSVANGSNGNSGTSASVSTSTAAEAIVVGCGVDRAGTTAITTSGYAMKSQSSTNIAGIAGKVTTSTVSSESTAWTFTNGPWWTCGTASFK